MKPQPTLKAELEGFLAVTNTQKEPLDETADAILQLISSRLPKRKNSSIYTLNKHPKDFMVRDAAEGYNQAVADFKAILESKE